MKIGRDAAELDAAGVDRVDGAAPRVGVPLRLDRLGIAVDDGGGSGVVARGDSVDESNLEEGVEDTNSPPTSVLKFLLTKRALGVTLGDSAAAAAAAGGGGIPAAAGVEDKCGDPTSEAIGFAPSATIADAALVIDSGVGVSPIVSTCVSTAIGINTL